MDYPHPFSVFFIALIVHTSNYTKMISELLPEEKRRLFELEQQLYHLESGNSLIRVTDISLGLNEMAKKIEELEKLANQEPKGRREDYKRRIQHLRSSHGHVRAGLDNFSKTNNSYQFDQQRQELFGKAPIRPDEENPYYDIEVAEQSSIHRSSKMVGDYIKTGQETLQELFSQRERLKGIQRKAFDVMNYLGISNTIMRAAERRDSVDRWIVFGGMVLILILLYFIIFYWRK